MCWMALIPVAIGLVSGAMQGQQQAAAAEGQAGELRQNAFFLNQAANDALARGRAESDLQRVQTQQMIGQQRAAMAGSGGQVDRGTNALLQQDVAQFGELDALTISNNAAREAYGYQVQAQSGLRNAAQLTKNAKSNILTSMLGGAVQGFGSAYSGGSLGSLFGGGGGVGAGTRAALTTNLNRVGLNQSLA